MRKLFILHGVPGSGKTHLVQTLGMERHALGLDMVREIFSGEHSTTDGFTSMMLRGHKRVAAVAYEALEARLDLGDLLFWDATTLSEKDIPRLVGMSRDYGYTPYVVNLQAGLDWETIRLRNLERGNDRLEESALRKMFDRGGEPLSRVVPAGVEVIEGFDEATRRIPEILAAEDAPVDLDKYEKIVVFGDIQSCSDALGQAVAEHGGENGLDNAANAWIFVGDLFDRGPDAAGVFEMLKKPRENVFLVEGNHDTNLRRVVNRTASGKSYRDTRTSLESILAAGHGTAEVKELLGRMRMGFAFTYRGENYVVTHGGVDFSRVAPAPAGGFPVRLSDHSTWELVFGTSGRPETYSGNCDYGMDTSAFASPELIQFHGHRNNVNTASPRPATVNGRVYNLEARVEHGGVLRVAVLSGAGVECFEYRDNQVVAWQALRAESVVSSEEVSDGSGSASATPISGETPRPENKTTAGETPADSANIAELIRSGDPKDPKVILAKLRVSPYIRESVVRGDIHAFNFTREAFAKGMWDESTVAARGLFVRGQDVVARGYEKFFEINDFSGHGFTRAEVEGELFEYPCRLATKENGFLGLVAAVDGELTVFSKSGITDYSEAAAAMLREALGSVEREVALTERLEASNVTLACEMIMLNDPHVIYHDKAEVVVLDAIKNDWQFAVDDAVADAVAGEFGLRRASVRMLETPEEFDIRALAAEAGEGFVLRDQAGRMVKIKTQFYRNIKRVRSEFNRVVAGRSRHLPEAYAEVEDVLREADVWGNWEEYLVITPGGRETLDLPRLIHDFHLESYFQE
ncbi:MAG: RNA ligase [Mobiluncus porci]|uniref:RNA ligase n=1 Tax=Mobiluncus porci TaxID=2652278 RepID=UPI0023F33511|nr:RNA ligase [Mobiluncus porci]MDD7542089.1 RNA ligase [Mobiluncus porci]MDY5749432.1 RNA ligase [Mobiluncus porci]